MPTLLIEEKAYSRIESEIRSICPDMEIVLIDASGDLRHNGNAVTIETVKPDIAWLSFDLFIYKLMQKFAELLVRTGSVKWMHTFSAGLDRPLYRDLFNQGIRITKSNAQAIAIAEYVISNVMTVFQDAFERKTHQKAHRWETTPFRELWQTCWLIIGFGNIGQEVAKRVKGFDCEVIAVRRGKAKHPCADSMITLNEVPDHLCRADVVVLACSLNAETRRLADHKFFRNMKPESIFVNIARGALVDEQALIKALKNGAPQYAVLDVFDSEPLHQESPLWELKNTIITPHSSYAGNGTNRRNDLLFLENLRRFLANEPLLQEASDERDFLK
jgi:phosphoglycerate dehydrogenase-like enzyme